MLQFNSILSHTLSSKLFPYWRLSSLLSTSVVNPETSNASKQDETTFIEDNGNLSGKNKVLENLTIPQQEPSKIPGPIKHIQRTKNSKTHIEIKIKNAQNTEELISILKSPGIQIDHVKKILHLISNKNVEEKKIKVMPANAKVSLAVTDLEKLKGAVMLPLSTPYLIQMLKKLSYTSDRNVPVLKTLAHNIAMYSDQLNIKLCGDILYSLSVLNYCDENLLSKIMLDLLEAIPENKSGPVLGSIVTSLGLLRYKNCQVLDTISKWTLDNYAKLRIQDFIATLQCFATFGYNPQNMSDLQKHISSLDKEVVKDDELWLDFVWSLTILNEAHPTHIASVLEPKFVDKILKISEHKYMAKILKLLNVNGAAKYLQKDYDGPFLNNETGILTTNIERRKQKQEFIELLDETLKEIAPFCFQTNVYTKMGFFIDAECYMDSNNEFVRMQDVSKAAMCTRLALMIHDYHDYSRGKEDLLGVIQFYNRILATKNYKVINISYQQFSINDKLIKRVKYLTGQIQTIHNL